MFLLWSALLVATIAVDPEALMTLEEIIRYWKYPVESIYVVTEDGYIINMLRIPHGRNKVNASCSRPPIMLVHGQLVDASEFVHNPPESSAGMILADAGFDVFLLNCRGTRHSQRHLNMTRDDLAFWQFTVDDMARYDAPAAIDKALELNRASSIYWIGHSQGTLVSLLTLAERPEYNAKIKAQFQLGPVGNLQGIQGLVRLLIWLAMKIEPALKMLDNTMGSREIGVDIFHIPSWLISDGARFCPIFAEGCYDTLFLALGPPAKTINLTRMPVYAPNGGTSSSTWNLLQYLQILMRKSIGHYDHSHADNMKRYGQTIAPPYNYSLITSDVYLFVGENDWLTTRANAEALKKMLNPGVVKEIYDVPDYNHIDYTYATDSKEKVYDKIVQVVRKRETATSCVQ